MLAGDDQLVKPDRMIVRFLAAAHGRNVTVIEAPSLVARACEILALERPNLTPRALDHAIWGYQRVSCRDRAGDRLGFEPAGPEQRFIGRRPAPLCEIPHPLDLVIQRPQVRGGSQSPAPFRNADYELGEKRVAAIDEFGRVREVPFSDVSRSLGLALACRMVEVCAVIKCGSRDILGDGWRERRRGDDRRVICP